MAKFEFVNVSESRRKNMRHIKSTDTECEVILRHALWQKGYRYRKNYKLLPGKPDICLTKYKIAVFCDSDYFHAWANDFDENTCKTYRKNICPDKPDSVYCSDVRNLDIKNLSPIDAFAYGFPCNSFSNVGKHKGLANEKYGQLYWYGIEVLKYHQPKWFVAENVSGIRSAGTNDFKTILHDMENAGIGYNLVVNLYKSEEYGIPQTRHRVIIVGIRKDQKVTFRVPDPSQYNHDIDISE